jgi:hypothetical protein
MFIGLFSYIAGLQLRQPHNCGRAYANGFPVFDEGLDVVKIRTAGNDFMSFELLSGTFLKTQSNKVFFYSMLSDLRNSCAS